MTAERELVCIGTYISFFLPSVLMINTLIKLIHYNSTRNTEEKKKKNHIYYCMDYSMSTSGFCGIKPNPSKIRYAHTKESANYKI